MGWNLTLLAMPTSELVTLAVGCAAVFLLDAFDISLPRGDSMSVSGALVSSLVVIVGPANASFVALAALLVANLARWGQLQPRAHFAAMAIRAVGLLAGGTAYWMLTAFGGHSVYMVAAAVAAAYLMAELVASQVAMTIATRRPLGRQMRGNFSRLSPLLAAQVSTAALTVIIYPEMRVWGLIPVVLLLLIMRQSYALLLEMRETYRTTVLVLVESAESQDPRRVGHAERTASIARSIGMRMGLPASDVERISYAALLHDVDALSDGGQTSEMQAGKSSEVLRDATWFSDVVPVLEICDGTPPCDGKLDDTCLIAAMVVALASDADAVAHEDVLEAHNFELAVARVSGSVPPPLKARAVAAALELGFSVGAVR